MGDGRVSLIPLLFDVAAYTAIFVLVVLGLGVIASMMGIFNFAHGEFVLIGALTVFLLNRIGLPVWLGMLASPLASAAVGLIVERLVVRRFYGSPVAAMVGTFAIGLIIREAVRMYLGGQYYSVPEPLGGSIAIGEASVSVWRALLIVITCLVLAGCYLFIRKTHIGLVIRGSLQDASLARVSGISTDRVYAVTFAFGTGLAGLAGGLIVPIYSINADIGVPFLVKSFLAIMLGGLGSFESAVYGAVGVGGVSAALPWFIKPVVAELIVFVAAITIVKFRQAGLLQRGRS
jgi:branched-chain amino acid transport system permease protein